MNQLTGCGEEGSGLNGHLELSGAQDEQLTPALLEQQRLVAPGQTQECRHVLRPLDGHEQQTRRRLADRLRVVEVRRRQLVWVLITQRKET